MILACPACRQTMTVEESQVGQTVACPKCGQIITVPNPAAPVGLPLGAVPTGEKPETWAMLCHLAALGTFVFPLGNIVGPLVIWLIKKDTLPIVDLEGRKALNFNISFAIYGIVAWLACFIIIGFLLVPALAITWLIFLITNSTKASRGEETKYPMSMTFFTLPLKLPTPGVDDLEPLSENIKNL